MKIRISLIFGYLLFNLIVWPQVGIAQTEINNEVGITFIEGKSVEKVVPLKKVIRSDKMTLATNRDSSRLPQTSSDQPLILELLGLVLFGLIWWFIGRRGRK